jgi:hypothetical protein
VADPDVAALVARIREKVAAATPGPWEFSLTEDGDSHVILMATALENRGNHESHHAIHYEHGLYPDEDEQPMAAQFREAEANAELVADAPGDLAALCDALDQQEQALATMTALLREATGWAQSSWREDADPIHAAELHRRLDGFLSRARAALAERPQ